VAILAIHRLVSADFWSGELRRFRGIIDDP
jgi:hypothetical protein